MNKKICGLSMIVLLIGMASLASAFSFSDLFSFFSLQAEEESPHHTVYLVSPANNSYTSQTNSTLQFVYNHTGSLAGVVNCTLLLDGTAVNYTESVAPNTNTVALFNQTITEGQRWWWANCTNGTASESSIDIGWNFTLNVDRTSPSINFTSPTPENNSFVPRNWTYINTTLTDFSPNSTALIDFNRSLVGWWRFNREAGENDTFARDWSTYGNNGTIYNTNPGIDNCTGNCSGWTASGKFGNGMRFDGVDDYVAVGNPTTLQVANEGSAYFWFNKRVSFPITYTGIVVKANGYGHTDQDWGFSTQGSNIIFRSYTTSWQIKTIATNVLTDEWHMYGATWYYNTTDGYTYIATSYDDIRDSFSTHTYSGKFPDTKSIRIGGYNSIGYYINGTIDEVRIYNRALSPEEINASYNAGVYRLYHNFTNLTDGTYTYTAYAQDLAGNVNQTEMRTLTIDTTQPFIGFVSPTDTNNAYLSRNYSYVNVSVSDANNVTAFVDWNRSLVGWWRFNREAGENDTLARDWSSYGNNGTLTNMNKGIDNGTSGWTSSGKFGNGMQFDRVNDYVDAGNGASLNNQNFTVEMWVNRSTVGTVNAGLFYTGSYSGNKGMGVYTFNNNYNLWFGNGTVKQYLGIFTLSTANIYNHIVITKNGSFVLTYVNGVLSSSGSYTDTIDYSGGNLIIGYGLSSIYAHNGSIDEVRIFNRALSPEEINASYNAGVYRLYHNFTGLSDGTYNYTAYAQDLAGNVNQTETRTLTVDTVKPTLTLVPPTAANQSFIGQNWTVINATASEDNVSMALRDSSLVLGMHFEMGSNGTRAADFSQYGNNGTLKNMNPGIDNCTGNCSGWTTSGKFGYGMRFDGVDDYVDAGNGASLNFSNKSFSVFVWVKLNNKISQYIVNGKTATGDSRWHLYVDSGNMMNVFLKSSDGTSVNSGGLTYTEGVWYYYGFVRDKSTGRLLQYRNGVLTNNVLDTTNNLTSQGVFTGSSSGASNFVNGSIDEVRIYNRSLSAEEISSIYNASVGRYRQFEANRTGIAPGNYSYYVEGIDLAGNINQSETRVLTINSLPSVNINSPIDNGHDRVNLSVSFTYDDADSTAGDCGLYINNTLNATNSSVPAGSTAILASTTMSGDGTYSWHISCSDGNYTANTTQRTYVLDTISPTIYWYAPKNDNATYSSQNLSLNVSCTDSNLYRMLINITNSTGYSINSTLYDSINSTTWGANYTVSLPQDGIYTVEASCTDDHTFGEMDLDYELQNESMEINSTYDYYNYGYANGKFTNWDGLVFQEQSDGIIKVSKDGQVISYFAFMIKGDVGGITYNRTSMDFSWNWSLSQNASRYNISAINNQSNFVWRQEYIFEKYSPNKIRNILTNNIATTQNTVMYYIFTVTNNDTITYNGTSYAVGSVGNIYKKGLFNDILAQIRFSNNLFFNFSDIISGYNVTEFYLGNASVIGYPGNKIAAIGFTKNNGVFPLGATAVIDPAIMSNATAANYTITNYTNISKSISFKKGGLEYLGITPQNISLNMAAAKSADKIKFNISMDSPQSDYNLTLRLHSDSGLTYRGDKSGVAGHFIYGNYYIDFADIARDYNVSVQQINATDAYVLISLPQGALLLDPVTGGLNTWTEYATYTFDTQNPQVALTSPEDSGWRNSLTVNFVFTPADTNLKNCSLWTNESGWSVKAWNSSALINGGSNSIQASFGADGSYAWNIKCFDAAQNSAFAPANYTVNIDTTPPSGITGLQNTSSQTWIFWSWTNPGGDFSFAEVWLNSTFKTNTSNSYYNATQLGPGRAYEIQVRPTDTHNNTNATFVAHLARTSGEDDYNPPLITAYSITPKAAVNGTNISLQAEAEDSVALHSIWAEITLPNASKAIIIPPANYTTSISGRYNITFFANDTSGNTVNITDHFIAEPAAAINITVSGYNNSAIGTNVTVYYDGNNIASNFSGSNYTLSLPDYAYGLEFASFNGSLVVLLRNVNISYNQGRAVLFDKANLPEYLAVYAVNNTFNITSAQVTIRYSETAYGNEDYLGLYKCDGWNISARSCTGAWNSLSFAQNRTAKTLAANVTSFSGFAIKQEPVPQPPSGGGGGSRSHGLEITGISANPVLAGGTSKASITVENSGNYDEESVNISVLCPVGWKCGSIMLNISRGSMASAGILLNTPKKAEPKTYTLTAKAESDFASAEQAFSFAIKPECASDSDCKKDETCLSKSCVKLFDAKIIRADSPIQPGEFFDFTYVMKGMADIKGDVIVRFWLQKDGKKITSGYDTIYMGSFEQKTETASIFLPGDAPVGNYDFYVEVDYGKYAAQTHRVIEVSREVPLILDAMLLKSPVVSLDTVSFSAVLSANKDGIIPLRLEERITREGKTVWYKERYVMINKSATLDESVSGLKAGSYVLELKGYYGNVSSQAAESFEIRAPERNYWSVVLPLATLAIAALLYFYTGRKKSRKPKSIHNEANG